MFAPEARCLKFSSHAAGISCVKEKWEETGFMGISKPNRKDLICLAELLEAGKVVPVIEKCTA